MAGATDIRAGRAFVELFLKDGAFTAGLKAAETKITAWGKTVSGVTSRIKSVSDDISRNLAVVSAAAGGVGLASIKGFGAVQGEIAKLRAAANPTAREMDDIKQAVTDISKATGQGPANVAASFTELLKAGTDTKTALGGAAEAVVKFSKVAEMDTAQAAVIVSDVLHVFSKEGLTASQAVDILSQAADSSSINLKQMAESFSMSSAVAGATGVKLRDLAAAIGIMGNAGLKGSDAGTAIKTMLLALAAPSETAEKAIAQYGFTARDARGNVKSLRDIIVELNAKLGGIDSASRDAALKDIFGTDAIRPALILMQQGVAGWDKFTEAMTSSMTVGEKFNVLMDTVGGQAEKLMASVQRLAAAIGEALASKFEEWSAWLEKSSGDIAAWAAKNGDAIVTVAKWTVYTAGAAIALKGLSMAITTVTAATSGLSMAAGGLKAAFAFLLANPVVGITAGIVAAAAAIMPWKSFGKALGWSLGSAKDASDKYAASSKDAAAATRAEHDAMKAKLMRLAELNSKQNATDDEIREAVQLATDLSNRYPQLADAIARVGSSAEATGKALAGMNAELEKSLTEDSLLAEKGKLQDQRKSTRDELNKLDIEDAAKEKAGKNIAKLGGEDKARSRRDALLVEAMKYARSDSKRSERAASTAKQIDRDIATASKPSTVKRREELNRKYDEIQGRIDDIDARLYGAQGGQKTPDEVGGKTPQPSKFTQKMNEAAGDAEIDSIRNPLSRELAKLDAKYAELLGKASNNEEAVAVSKAYTAEVESVRKKYLDDIKRHGEQATQAIIIGAIQNEHDREIASIKAKYAQDLEDAADNAEARQAIESRMNQEIAAANEAYGVRQEERGKDLDAQIAREQLSLKYRGQKLAVEQNEADRREALRNAAKTGDDVDRVNQLYDAKRDVIKRQGYSAMFGGGPSGTFSADAAAIMGNGGPNEQTAKNTAVMARYLYQILAKTGNDNWNAR